MDPPPEEDEDFWLYGASEEKEDPQVKEEPLSPSKTANIVTNIDLEDNLFNDEETSAPNEVIGDPEGNSEIHPKIEEDEDAIPHVVGSGDEVEDEEGDEDDEDGDDSDDSDDGIQITIGEIVPTSNASGPVNIAITKHRVNLGPGPGKGPKGQALDVEGTEGLYNGQSIYDLNIDSMDEKPWRKPGADITDYFNYGFTEDSWKLYSDKQRRLRSDNGPTTSGMMGGSGAIGGSNQIPSNGLRLEPTMKVIVPSIAPSMMNTLPPGVQVPLMNRNLTQITKAGPPPDRKIAGGIQVLGSGGGIIPNVNTPPPSLLGNMPLRTPMMSIPNTSAPPPSIPNSGNTGSGNNFIQVVGRVPPNSSIPPPVPPNLNVPPPFTHMPPPPIFNQPPPNLDVPPPYLPPSLLNAPPPSFHDGGDRHDFNHRYGPGGPNGGGGGGGLLMDPPLSMKIDPYEELYDERRDQEDHYRHSSRDLSETHYPDPRSYRDDPYRTSREIRYSDHRDEHDHRLDERGHRLDDRDRDRDRDREYRDKSSSKRLDIPSSSSSSSRHRDRKEEKDRDRKDSDKDRDRDRDRKEDKDRKEDRKKDRKSQDRKEPKRKHDKEESSRHKHSSSSSKRPRREKEDPKD